MSSQTRRRTRVDERKPVRERWTSLSGGGNGDADEARAGALLRAAVVRQPRSAGELAVIHERLRRQRWPRAPRLVWQLAIGLGLVLFGGALVAAAARFTRWPGSERWLHTAMAPQPAALRAQPVSPSLSSTPAPGVAPPVADVAAAAVDPPPLAGNVRVADVDVRSAAAGLRHVPAFATSRRAPLAAPPTAPGGTASATAPALSAAPVPAAAPSVGADPSALARESLLLGAAMRKLRQERDPRGALALLDQHAAQFGATGALLPEANVTRIEAWLQQGDERRALALLETPAPTSSGRGRELLILRGELRARAGRCIDALVDFGALLDGGGSAADSLAERALYGRASCRARQGDGAGARDDLESYLARFPNGRFAGAARATLQR